MRVRFWMCLLLSAVVCGPAFAQEDDDIDKYFNGIDTDENDKLSIDEMKGHAYTELAEDASDRDKLIAWGPHIIDFVLADSDDDLSVTRKEFRDYIAAMQGEAKITFSAKDWAFYQKDYLDPYIAATMKAADKDGDDALSKDEYNTLSDASPEEFAEVDLNKDGKITGAEYKEVIKQYLIDYYDFQGDNTEDPELVKTRFNGIDKNTDGSISVAEWKEHALQPDASAADWSGLYLVFLVVDTNDDLKISLEEFTQFGEDQRNNVKPKLKPVDREALLDQFWEATDSNEDGKLNREEYVAKAPAGSEALYGAEFDEMDVDESGDASRDEVWNSFKQHFGSYDIIEEETKDETTEDETSGGGDWDLYKKEGRSWMYKSVSNYGGTETVNFMKYEVIKVGKHHAILKATMLDKDKQPQPGMEPTETRINFVTESDESTDGPEVKDLGEKTMKVEGGEFECKGVEVTVDETTTTSWMHKKYPALIVSVNSKGEAGSSSMELVEFNE